MNKTVANAKGQKGVCFKMRFIEPGLVYYEDLGTVLVQKPALDAMAQSFVGKPVFVLHQSTANDDFSSGRADGIVSRVWYEQADGWYWLEALVWDPDALTNIDRGYSLSCAYDVLKWTDAQGKHNNIAYVNEVVGGEYTHLALVPNPRYEGARIIYNQGGHMKIKLWPFQKDKKPEEVQASEVELTNALVEVEGKEVPLEEIVNGFKAEELRKAEELKNAKAKLADEDTIDVDGKKVLVKDLRAGYLANAALSAKNAMEEDHKDGKHKEKEVEACNLCNAARKNTEEEEKKKKEEEDAKEKERSNSLAAEEAAKAKERLEALRNAKDKGLKPVMPEAPADQASRLAAGAERYGAVTN